MPFRGRSRMNRKGILPIIGGLLLALAVAGCQIGGKTAAPSDVAAPTALQGPAVGVTSLAPIESAEAVQTGPLDAKPVPDKAEKAGQAPIAVKVKSASEIACEKRGGHFVSVGRSGAMTCQMPTRDGGKQCTRESDCDGLCLARSNSCAPVKPLLGCQAILQDDGRRVELCID